MIAQRLTRPNIPALFHQSKASAPGVTAISDTNKLRSFCTSSDGPQDLVFIHVDPHKSAVIGRHDLFTIADHYRSIVFHRVSSQKLLHRIDKNTAILLGCMVKGNKDS